MGLRAIRNIQIRQGKLKMMQRGRQQGFSLVEILVALVVLAIGILYLLRIFPIAITGLNVTKDYSNAHLLANGQMDFLRARAEDLPAQILAVEYVYVLINGNWQLVLRSDPLTPSYDLGPGGPILENGNIVIDNPGGTDTEIFWRYYNDANRFRRIIGEGGKIPAPKPVANDFGGLRVLNFGPAVNDPSLLLVYSDDLEGRLLVDTDPGDRLPSPRPWQFAYDDEVPQAWFPGVAGRDVSYKVTFGYWANQGGNIRRVDIIDRVVTVRDGVEYDSNTNTVAPFDLFALAGSPADWIEIIPDTVSANRLFDPIPTNNVFDPSYPYEYKVLNGDLGILLFNPAGYNYRERRGNQRVPLRAQINYDVFNWHIIRDEFRADQTRSPLQKLSLERIKPFNTVLNDQRRYPGLEVAVPDGTGGFVRDRDVIVIDMDTGGIVSPRINPADPNSKLSYKVDYLRGVIAMGSPFVNPNDPDLARSITIILPSDPGDPNPVIITNVNPGGRNFRVLYQAQNDWAVQVMKAPARYEIVYGLPLGIAQAYVGDTGSGGRPTRIYFPPCDIGMKVSVREIWYRDNMGRSRVMRDQDFLIRAPQPGDIPTWGFADIRDVDADAVAFDFSVNGYAVRGVAGTSLMTRVLWNTLGKRDVPGNAPQNIAERMELHEEWSRGWKRVVQQTYLTRRDLN